MDSEEFATTVVNWLMERIERVLDCENLRDGVHEIYLTLAEARGLGIVLPLESRFAELVFRQLKQSSRQRPDIMFVSRRVLYRAWLDVASLRINVQRV